ncbi:unnamed protein product [Lepeophtheirus salmonis]|uniref:(salmon louse) hypothetical protein n=1 Tax=Lepeophtheirus salmonis TaxID=72036 RepID=A0A7R8CMW2_LEPSM|nr:unnamed protein product [Lepeophtheirus salmonis]CAF2824782.1 unnamed protein product [Lepeophtheirus salmonis]
MHQKYLEENGFVTGSKSYNVGKELGRGGFSSIFSLDEQTFPHRSYALKITMAENERHDLLLQKEIDFLRDLSDSKRIIKMIANDIQDGFIFIVLELAEINLIQYLEKNHTNWIDLQEIHDKGIIHMDLKLENFVIVNHVLKIIDFGAAFQLPKGKIEMDVDEIFGTEGLCAPECFHNRVVETNDGNIHTISSISQKCDIWSLGIMLLQSLEPNFDLASVIKKINNISLNDSIHPGVTQVKKGIFVMDTSNSAMICFILGVILIDLSDGILKSTCTLNKDPGTCAKNITQYYFNKDLKSCESFTWGGCEGNKNRFDTVLECNDVCQPSSKELSDNHPELSQKKKTQESSDEDYDYYNLNFIQENKNEEVARNISDRDGSICGLPVEIGNCTKHSPRFFYNMQSGSCQFFIWKGCVKNENNFISIKKCLDKCHGVVKKESSITQVTSQCTLPPKKSILS